MTSSPLRLDDRDHVVQFYDRDDELVPIVAGYLAAAVRDGDAVIVIATPAHRRAFRSALAAAGVDLDHATAAGQYVALDAAEVLERFMRGGHPDPAAFAASVGRLVSDRAVDHPRVRAYGEMVALLWAEEQTTAAIELEELWNNLATRVPFALFCAYPSNGGMADPIGHVCALHSSVVAGAPTPEAMSVRRSFGTALEDASRARHFVAETLARWDLSAFEDECRLLVTELAANAIRHAGSPFTVSLSWQNSSLHLGVGDASPRLPLVRGHDADATGGRGLQLVARIAADWGCTPSADGKVVWARLTNGEDRQRDRAAGAASGSR